MHQEKYSLTWHSYSDHLKNMMKELMMDEDYSDITLVTEDKKQMKANRNILSACSPVFREILKKEKNSSTIMYLRGIQYSEIESIIQFIYLGEATFFEERMEEFLTVAKSLEIKVLCDAKTKTNDEPNDEPSTNDSFTENLKEETVVLENPEIQATQERQRRVRIVDGKYECELCQRTYAHRNGLFTHRKSFHRGFKYTCDQCDHQFTQPGQLNVHIKSKHEGIKFACDQCDYQAGTRGGLRRHEENRHKVV